ncbi:hypothetical protein SSRP02_p001 [Synechococcus phage S-SRP02]|nr:hypothetical protein SSRP02_p001 [Synechococcus phage S-SRP02]
MPFSYAQYAGNGTTTTFSVPFPYLLKAHVKAYIGLNQVTGGYDDLLVEGIDYTWTSGTQVQTALAPSIGTTLTIRRETPTESRLVDWNDGSNLIADDLDTADLQNFYSVQEQRDLIQVMSITPSANLADGSVTSNALSSDSVTSVKIADGAVTSPKIANGAVATAKMADGSVTTQKIAAGAVTQDQIAAGAVGTTGLASGALAASTAGREKMADQFVTTAKLVDASVTSGKIADSAVDASKLADGAVGTAKLADGAVGSQAG